MSTDLLSGFYGIHLEQLGSTTEVLQAISAILILGGIAATVQIVWYLFTTKAALLPYRGNTFGFRYCAEYFRVCGACVDVPGTILSASS